MFPYQEAPVPSFPECFLGQEQSWARLSAAEMDLHHRFQAQALWRILNLELQKQASIIACLALAGEAQLQALSATGQGLRPPQLFERKIRRRQYLQAQTLRIDDLPQGVARLGKLTCAYFRTRDHPLYRT